MKRSDIKFVIIILIAWLPLFIGAWDKTLPSGSKDYDLGDDDIRTNNTAIEAALDQDHDFATGSTQTGKHNMVSLIETANLGTGAEDQVAQSSSGYLSRDGADRRPAG